MTPASPVTVTTRSTSLMTTTDAKQCDACGTFGCVVRVELCTPTASKNKERIQYSQLRFAQPKPSPACWHHETPRASSCLRRSQQQQKKSDPTAGVPPAGNRNQPIESGTAARGSPPQCPQCPSRTVRAWTAAAARPASAAWQRGPAVPGPAAGLRRAGTLGRKTSGPGAGLRVAGCAAGAGLLGRV